LINDSLPASAATSTRILLASLALAPFLFQLFKVPVNAIRMSGLVNEIIKEQDEEVIGKQDTKLQNVSGVILKRVVDFCTHYQEEAMNEVVAKGKEKLEEIVTQKWYLNFTKSFDGDRLFCLIRATNYLDIQPLLSLSVLDLW
jgi:S-phase kinase-associated protein 1